MQSAFLIVHCDLKSNEIIGVDIWSAPPWEVTQMLPASKADYVAMQITADSFDQARQMMERHLLEERSLVSHLAKHYAKEEFAPPEGS